MVNKRLKEVDLIQSRLLSQQQSDQGEPPLYQLTRESMHLAHTKALIDRTPPTHSKCL